MAEAAGLLLTELPALAQTSTLIDEEPCGIRNSLVGWAFLWGWGFAIQLEVIKGAFQLPHRTNAGEL